MLNLGQLFSGGQLEDREREIVDLKDKLSHLNETNEHLTLMVKALTQGMFAVEPDGSIYFWSTGLERMLGISYEQALGKKYTHFFPPLIEMGSDPVLATIESRTKQSIEIEWMVTNHNTTPTEDDDHFPTLPIELVFLPMLNEQEQIAGVVVEVKDLSDRKHLEEMQLDFVSIVSHELRTPATNIKGYLSVLLSEGAELTNEHREFVLRAFVSNERQIHTIESLLTVSQIEKGQFDMKSEPVQLEPIVTDVIEYFNEQAKTKGLTLKTIYPEFAIPKVYGDPAFLQQIIYILISNGIKFTEQGSVEIRMSREDNTITLAVKDTGIGIPQKAQDSIFERFKRGERPLIEQTQGLGLGLYVAKTLVEKMKGRIWFESKEGQGSTFHISLPVA